MIPLGSECDYNSITSIYRKWEECKGIGCELRRPCHRIGGPGNPYPGCPEKVYPQQDAYPRFAIINGGKIIYLV